MCVAAYVDSSIAWVVAACADACVRACVRACAYLGHLNPIAAQLHDQSSNGPNQEMQT